MGKRQRTLHISLVILFPCMKHPGGAGECPHHRGEGDLKRGFRCGLKWTASN